MADYPDTNFPDAVDPLYGGEAGRKFGGPAWDWICNAMYAVQIAVFQLLKPYRIGRLKVASAVTAGDILVEVLDGAEDDYTVRKLSDVTYDPDTTLRVGMAAESAGAREQCYVIFDGPGIPPAIHGLGTGAAGRIRVNKWTSRVERSGPSGAYYYDEVIIGTVNTRGYVRLFPRTDTNE